MARYRGKREESHGERMWEEKKSPKDIGDPFRDIPPAGIGDPFAEDNRKMAAKQPKRDLKAWWGAYWDSGKGKILVTVLSCLAVFAVVVIVVAKMWIKPPALPAEPGNTADLPQQTNTSDQKDPPGDDGEQGTELSDDELYPDDGYNGDMPTVSGNRKEGVYTFLLVGTDMDDGNTDTIMVVSYDTKEQNVNIMSIPRDTMINESWDIKKINSVYSRTGGSVDSLANRIQKLIGFKPDFYVKVDLSMFVKLVDLVGGVEFDVPQDMDYEDQYQSLYIHLKKGVQVLDGEHAMQLVRFRRYSEGDIKRVEVQQEFMKALIKECLSIKHWGKIKAYIDLAMENVQTDLEAGSVIWFAANVLGLNGVPALDMEDVYTCTLPGNYYTSTWCRSIPNAKDPQSYVTIYPNQVVTLVTERFNPYEQRVTAGMLDAMSILSNGDIASSTGTLKDQTHNGWMAVRRGEAYYDDEGKVVYGTPPVKPEKDEDGNYYILDEDGEKIYTDQDGNPLENGEPRLPSDTGDGQPVTLPQTPTDGNRPGNQTGTGGGQNNGQNNTGNNGQTDPEDQDEPSLPEEPETNEPETQEPETEEPTESEMPEWLRPRSD